MLLTLCSFVTRVLNKGKTLVFSFDLDAYRLGVRPSNASCDFTLCFQLCINRIFTADSINRVLHVPSISRNGLLREQKPSVPWESWHCLRNCQRYGLRMNIPMIIGRLFLDTLCPEDFGSLLRLLPNSGGCWTGVGSADFDKTGRGMLWSQMELRP